MISRWEREGGLASRRQYYTTLDRAGLALGVGGILGGFVVLLLAAVDGDMSGAGLVTLWLIATLSMPFIIGAIAGPFWAALHFNGFRRSWHAAVLAGSLVMVVLVAGQTYGFGLAQAPVSDGGTMFYRWISALATSGLIAIVAAGIAVAMWRVAYRPV